jgi:hypothetical protein
MSSAKMNKPPRSISRAVIVWALCAGTCIASTIDQMPIPPDARNVHRQTFADSNSKELSYQVERPYPQDSPSAEQSRVLAAGRWAKCVGPIDGWDSYVDASRGKEHERTVFQNVSYWSRGDAVLMMASFYYGPVAENGRPVQAPGNTSEFVAITEDDNPQVKEKLKLTCPK